MDKCNKDAKQHGNTVTHCSSQPATYRHCAILAYTPGGVIKGKKVDKFLIPHLKFQVIELVSNFYYSLMRMPTIVAITRNLLHHSIYCRYFGIAIPNTVKISKITEEVRTSKNLESEVKSLK